jgi:hypothetical protein
MHTGKSFSIKEANLGARGSLSGKAESVNFRANFTVSGTIVRFHATQQLKGTVATDFSAGMNRWYRGLS